MNDKKYYINEHAVVDDNVEIGEGTKIWHFTHVQSGAKIGKKCVLGQNVNVANNVTIGNFVKIQNNVSVYEGVTLEDYVFCGPSMVFTNILGRKVEFVEDLMGEYARRRIESLKKGEFLPSAKIHPFF